MLSTRRTPLSTGVGAGRRPRRLVALPAALPAVRRVSVVLCPAKGSRRHGRGAEAQGRSRQSDAGRSMFGGERDAEPVGAEAWGATGPERFTTMSIASRGDATVTAAELAGTGARSATRRAPRLRAPNQTHDIPGATSRAVMGRFSRNRGDRTGAADIDGAAPSGIMSRAVNKESSINRTDDIDGEAGRALAAAHGPGSAPQARPRRHGVGRLDPPVRCPSRAATPCRERPPPLAGPCPRAAAHPPRPRPPVSAAQAPGRPAGPSARRGT